MHLGPNPPPPSLEMASLTARPPRLPVRRSAASSQRAAVAAPPSVSPTEPASPRSVAGSKPASLAKALLTVSASAALAGVPGAAVAAGRSSQLVAQTSAANILGTLAVALFVLLSASFLLILYVKSSGEGNVAGERARLVCVCARAWSCAVS